MKKNYIKPYMRAISSVETSMLCLSISDGSADGSPALIKQRDVFSIDAYGENNKETENIWIYEE